VSPRQRLVAGVVIGVLYAVQTIARGDLLPGLVGGVLAAVLTVLVLREVGARQERRRRGGG
jgi:L-lactate permease